MVNGSLITGRKAKIWATRITTCGSFRPDGSAEARNLTAHYDLHMGSGTINDVGEPETMPPAWSLDSQTIYFPEVYHGSSFCQKIGLDGKRPDR